MTGPTCWVIGCGAEATDWIRVGYDKKPVCDKHFHGQVTHAGGGQS